MPKKQYSTKKNKKFHEESYFNEFYNSTSKLKKVVYIPKSQSSYVDLIYFLFNKK